MNPFDMDYILRRFEWLSQRIEMMHLDAYLRHVHDWKRRLFFDFLSGVARGIGSYCGE